MPPLSTATLLAIRLYVAGSVPTAQLDAALLAAASSLASAGLAADWCDCARGQAAGRCLEPLAPGELMVRVQPGLFAASRDVTLGSALVDRVNGEGTVATVYPDRVERVARAAQVSPATLLGRAIAHEIGHLLLGTTAHPPGGLMRARWTRAELQRDREDDWRFSPDERVHIRARIASRQQVNQAAPGQGGTSGHRPPYNGGQYRPWNRHPVPSAPNSSTRSPAGERLPSSLIRMPARPR